MNALVDVLERVVLCPLDESAVVDASELGVASR